MNWYLNAFKNYANFYGRASRTEYWMFLVFNITFAIITYSIDLTFDLGNEKYGFGILYTLYALICFIPGLALAVRRLHDVNKSGWYFLLALVPLLNIYLIVLFCTKSDEENNDYGDKPVNSDIGEFIPNNKTINSTIIIVTLWFLLNHLVWSIIRRYGDELYTNEYFKYFRITLDLCWVVIPLFLSFAVKNKIWKIVLIIGSLLYLFHNFYTMLEAHLSSNNLFQF